MINLDSEQYVKEAICQWLNNNSQGDFPTMKTEDVITLRVVDTDIIALINCGVKGTPKFTIPAEKLEFMPKPKKVDVKPKSKPPTTRRKRNTKK